MNDEKAPETQTQGSPPKKSRGHWRLILGVIIVVVGFIFLLKNTGWLGNNWDFDNWWALLILIPAVGSFMNARTAYKAGGRQLNSSAVRSIVFGLLFVALTLIFLLKPDWHKVWPVFAVIVGVGIALSWKKN